jgi:hypothetical protein
VTDPGVPEDDMLNLRWRPRADVPPVGDAALDALLDPAQGPDSAVAPLRPTAEVLAALLASPRRTELAGLDRVLAEFRAADGRAARAAGDMAARAADGRGARAADGRGADSRRVGPVRPARRRARLFVTLGAAAVAALVAMFGAVGYADMLPATLQAFAHTAIAAPAPTRTHTGVRTLVPARGGIGTTQGAEASTSPGRGPSTAAAYGLCNAYQHAVAHGSATQRAAAFRKLAAAAGGTENIAGFCRTVPLPGSSLPGNQTGRPGHPPGGPAGHHKNAPQNGAEPSAGQPKAKPTHTPPGKAKPTHTPPGKSR